MKCSKKNSKIKPNTDSERLLKINGQLKDLKKEKKEVRTRIMQERRSILAQINTIKKDFFALKKKKKPITKVFPKNTSPLTDF